jgi:septation ring formation regulator EzrA
LPAPPSRFGSCCSRIKRFAAFAATSRIPPNPQLGQSIEDLNRRVQEIEDWRKKFVDKLERDKGEILEAGEQRATRIHEHIENDRRELDGKIDALPDRVITILKNTGALRR